MTTCKVETNVRYAEGKLITGGVSGVIELLESGQILKSPYVGRRAADSQEDLQIEADIYQHLRYHPRLIRLFRYSAEEGLFLKYMPNGNLKQYIQTHSREITLDQKLEWACEAAEGLQFLHSRGVIHCDMKLTNLLLDSDRRLNIVDFVGSSLNGSNPTIHGDQRFTLTVTDRRMCALTSLASVQRCTKS
jgi:serine/threonine protein kinase